MLLKFYNMFSSCIIHVLIMVFNHIFNVIHCFALSPAVRDIVLNTSKDKILELSRIFHNLVLEHFRMKNLLETSELDSFIGLEVYIRVEAERFFSLDNVFLRVLAHLTWCWSCIHQVNISFLAFLFLISYWSFSYPWHLPNMTIS